MAGEPKYTHDQIALILLRWVQGVSAAETAVEYARVFNVEVLESQVKYVKNKYCKEPRFGYVFPLLPPSILLEIAN